VSSKVSRSLIAVLVVLIVVAGVVGYFASSATIPPAQTITITAGVGTPATITQIKTVTQTIAATPTPEKTYKWKMTTFMSTAHPGYAITKYFTELVKNLSNGRLIIELHPGGELFPIPETLNAVARGTVEIAEITIAYWTAEDPVFALATNKPGPLIKGSDALYEMMSILDIFKTHLERRGVIYLGPFDYAPPEILMCRFPIKSLDDLKGKLVRSAGMSVPFYEALGAKAVQLMPSELYQALQLGTVDCAEWGDYARNYQLGFHEVAKYVLEPTKGVNLHSDSAVHAFLVFNPAVWEKLPKEYQEAIKSACSEAYKWGGEHLAKINQEYRKKWIEAGAKISQLPPQDHEKVIAVGAKLISNYAAKSPEAKEYCTKLINVWKELGYEKWSKALAELVK